MHRLALATSVLLALLAAGCRRQSAPPPGPPPIVADPASLRTLAQGAVVGRGETPGTWSWLGIPYAEAPVGALRWKAPRPPQPWKGTREALHFGSVCPQIGGVTAGLPKEQHGQLVGSEDCLTLNVYAPRAAPEKRPVMVWIHGGGNTVGASAAYEATRNLVERHGVVMVTVNYRLGPLGWFHHPALQAETDSPEDRSGNYGTLDLVRALEWVRDNVAAFGGDPGNVTLFGESAGAFNTLSLLVSPRARGLFHKAISQSGMANSYSLADATHFTDDAEPGQAGSSSEVAASLLVKKGQAKDRADAKAKLAAMPAAELAALLRAATPAELIAHFKPGPMGMYTAPAILRDGVVLPSEPFPEVLARPGGAAPVPVVLGTNRDEFKLFMALDPQHVDLWFGKIPHVKDEADYERTARAYSTLWKALGVDVPAERLTAAKGGPVYAYRFDWDEAGTRFTVDMSKLLGAAHAMEISQVFLQFDRDWFGVASAENLAGRREVGEAMASYWTEFAYTGNPGRGRDGKLPEWGAWEGEGGRFMVFDSSRDGGVRMTSAPARVADVFQRLVDDPALAKKGEQRCKLMDKLFVWARWGGVAGPDDFAALTHGTCAAPSVAAGASR